MIYPKHVAIIPDWNRTWAKNKWLPKFVGHTEWFNNVVKLTKYIFTQTPIQAVTVWWLSTENLKNRSKKELDYLFDIYKNWWENIDKFLKENKINFKRIWSEKWLPSNLVEFLKEKQKIHKYNSDRYNIVAINYWWRDEIIRGINALLEDYKKFGNKFFDEIDENTFTKYLDLADIPPVDLVIRTKWWVAKRLSGFMLWWIGYAELYFTEKYFPDFDIDELNKALEWFDSIYTERNFGK